MADNRRLQRYADLLKRRVGEIIEFKISDPQKGMITLTGARVSPDLRIASLNYTVFGDEVQRKKSAEVLKKAVPLIKKELKPYITSRFLPDLRFFYDDSLDYANHIDQLLKKINDDSGNNEAASANPD
jgi:ribosome-binding factor A